MDAPSAADFDTMRKLVLPPIENAEPFAETTHTWTITNYSSLPQKAHGPKFDCGGFEWGVLLFPQGNGASSMSLYLEATHPPKKYDGFTDEVDDSWAVCAQFGLVIWNPEHPEIFHRNTANHRFYSDESDWGFTKFQDLHALTQRTKDKPALLEGDSISITAYVRVMKDPTGVLWHNFLKYDSKKSTGHVGLKNQGATCYLNSLLQSLFFTKTFRKSVYHIPTENDVPVNSVPYSLQRLFYQLQVSPHPIDTLELTQSFGWDSADAFTQHDVQELLRVLMDNLEGKMKGTSVEKSLNETFVGKMKSFIKCVNVDFESSRSEEYWDIQLNVKGMKTVEDSFKDYIQVEMLEGENQYEATGLGLQDAKKGVVFQSFPPVLHLQLKRYEYDFNRDVMVKINDRYEFPPEIDLSPYLDHDPSVHNSTNKDDYKYILHGVLVHSGDVNAGHYYALIKPNANGDWFKFDDDRVTRATDIEVYEDNFGADIGAIAPKFSNRLMYNKYQIKRHTSAYMLVYIRKTSITDILAPVLDTDVPRHIPEKLEQEAKEMEKALKEQEEMPLYLNARVFHPKSFEAYQGFDLGPDEKTSTPDLPEEAYPLQLRVLKTMPFKDFVKLVAAQLGYKSDKDIRLWILVNRQNRTVRPDVPILTDTEASVDKVREAMSVKSQILRIWVEEKQQQQFALPSVLTNFKEKGQDQEWIIEPTAIDPHSLIFLKYFDPFTQTIKGIGHFIISDGDLVGDLYPFINKLMGWPKETVLKLFEEIQPLNISEMKPDLTFSQAEIQNGDIICFEKQYSKEELAPLNETNYVDAKSFYDYLNHRVQISFRPYVHHEDDENEEEREFNDDDTITVDPEEEVENDNTEDLEKSKVIPKNFKIWVHSKTSYDGLAQLVGNKLGIDYTHLRFYYTGGNHRQTVKRSNSATIQTIFPNLQNFISRLHTQQQHLLAYEILEMSLAELENMKLVKIAYLPEGLVHEQNLEFYIPKDSDVATLIRHLQKKLQLSDDIAKDINVWGTHWNKFNKLFYMDSAVSQIPDSLQLYASPLPEESQALSNIAQRPVSLGSINKIWNEANGDTEDKDGDLLMNSDSPKPLGIVKVFHYQKEPNRVHGVPFAFILYENEPFSETKKRLQRRLCFKDKEFEKVKVAIIRSGSSKAFYPSDESITANEFEAEDTLGLDHFDKTLHRKGYSERAIFIKN